MNNKTIFLEEWLKSNPLPVAMNSKSGFSVRLECCMQGLNPPGSSIKKVSLMHKNGPADQSLQGFLEEIALEDRKWDEKER